MDDARDIGRAREDSHGLNRHDRWNYIYIDIYIHSLTHSFIHSFHSFMVVVVVVVVVEAKTGKAAEGGEAKKG